MWPSGPAAIPNGSDEAAGVWNSVISPVGVILPTAAGLASVNQRFPSGANVIFSTPLPPSGSVNSSLAECDPFVAIRSILLPAPNHSLPPGPEVTAEIVVSVGTEVANRCTSPPVVTAPISSFNPTHKRLSGPTVMEAEPPDLAPDPYS